MLRCGERSPVFEKILGSDGVVDSGPDRQRSGGADKHEIHRNAYCREHGSAKQGNKDCGKLQRCFRLADGFCGMEIMGKAYTEKADAGEILLAACKDTKSADPVPLGSYRGFQMELSFDSFRNEFDVTLKGAVSHRVALGTDARGNITRLDNALAGILERLERANEQLNNLYNQQEAAKAEVGKPFPQEAELTAKSQRLAELDAALNMEDSVENRDERSESERPSVLADLKSKAEHIPPAKYSETREEVL